ncbi:HPt (histidine-containing phosphotransfer) domain-containing protein [Pseudomonas asplenii]|uniref:HPt (Histidine-containing phosphotransfer) domain-containing protein n=1 Tax=Pseudomonas asplenii TaxID=53407 RepID=A0A1H1W326_9PSED|nr:Hpt domain-containing protein [Pseudomonas asplenii]SDS91474.1 HPt (histidine-containing phosphotransfer) domain-containing protein [Pseudomonas asplenii]
MNFNQEKHLDYEVLSALQEVMEDEYPVLLETFLNDSEKRLGQLHQADNRVELGLLAHSFKGSSSNMGALYLADLCRQLEEQAMQLPLIEVEELLGRIDREYEQVRHLYACERERFPVKQ